MAGNALKWWISLALKIKESNKTQPEQQPSALASIDLRFIPRASATACTLSALCTRGSHLMEIVFGTPLRVIFEVLKETLYKKKVKKDLPHKSTNNGIEKFLIVTPGSIKDPVQKNESLYE
ncbi:hypothetical protein EVAR_19089_1 [Eumeta japonica]|uniref:Uncharacterized protein n=1 Tax=Eumeta variegata TaxID=151549 RepID=A0A4C1UPV0_EUMVA|nr:hypothetical protein EVAR_19089_1 [Eumeta japonica]